MNRQQRRRSAHVSKKSKAPFDKQLSQRARFEQDLRTALECEGIKLVNAVPGQEQTEAGNPTGETYWVFTVHAEGRFIHVRSGRGTLADVASGVTRAVRDAIKKQDEPAGAIFVPTPSTAAPPPEPTPPVQLDSNGNSPLGALIGQFAAAGVAPIVLESELSLAERIRRAQSGRP